MPLLILNAGSSSLKFTLIEAATEHVLAQETRELAVAGSDAGSNAGPHAGTNANVNATAIDDLLRQILRDLPAPVDAVAHRVVHGGSRFTAPVRITPEVRAALGDLTPLAPLHNPPSLAVIDAAIDMFPDIPHIAFFDTAFHATLAAEAYTYPIPREWTSRWGIRRFGFHGLSHAYGARRAAEMLGRAQEGLHVIVAHLGNGASVTATRSGASVDTTMGFTPLEGLMMGTRSGSIDPGLLLYLQRHGGVSTEELEHALNSESGLAGVSGVSSDMRQVLAAAAGGNADAVLAFRIFVHRARQAIGAMAVTLGRVDALVFTGGIGEHSAVVRVAICKGLDCIGLRLDVGANHACTPDAIISSATSAGSILVVAAREDLTIARATTTATP